jgi:methyl-accepting chemotaxis protein
MRTHNRYTENMMNIKTKLTLAFLVIGTIPAVIVAFIGWNAAGNIGQSVEDQMVTTSVSMMDKIERNLFERYGDVQAFGLNTVVQNSESWYTNEATNPIVQAMDNYVATYGIYYYTLLVDTDGRVIATNQKNATGQPIDTNILLTKNYNNEGWFRDAMSGNFLETDLLSGTVVQDVHFDSDVARIFGNEAMTIGYAAPVRDSDGNIIAIWKNYATWDLVDEIVASTQQGLASSGFPGAEITLTTLDGKIITQTGSAEGSFFHALANSSGNSEIDSAGIASVLSEGEGNTGVVRSKHSSSDEWMTSSFAQSEGALGYAGKQWTGIIRLPESTSLGMVGAIRSKLATVTGIAAVCVGVVAFFIAISLVKPIKKLTALVVDISLGNKDLNEKATEGKDEIGNLGASFNSFLENLAEANVANNDYKGQIESIGKSQAVIEFNMDGTIVNANENFLSTVGYSLNEIKGKHHSMFCESSYTTSNDYGQFWKGLNDGTFNAGEFKRIGKGGKEIWIQASYNPILDLEGKPFKVVKYASDISAAKAAEFEASKAQEREAQTARENQERDARVAQELQDKVSQLLCVATAAGGGDLTQPIEITGDDSMGMLANGFREMIGSISSTLANVNSGANQIDSGTNQIASSSQSLASGASQQAASLEEISASLEELSSMTNQNADNAVQATTLSSESQTSASKGQAEMKMMSTAMDEIKSSSSQISKIIKVIDEIAFQTNLLALNAAVEAARAGEAGKGFAVVADEVRNLAQRSAEAAKSTSAMIEESTQRADNGVSIAARVGEVFEEIVSGTSKVNTLLDEISSAAKEQSTGITEINSGVGELDKVTQQNAGNAEELASAAQQNASEVAQLRNMVNQFKINAEATVTHKEPVAAAASSGTRSTSTATAKAPKPSIPSQPTEVDFMDF